MLLFLLGVARQAHHNFGDCQNLPTVEECQLVAERLEERCLRECVISQCREAMALCHNVVRTRCTERNITLEKGALGGSVRKGGDCKKPVKEFDWCNLNVSPPCQALIMVHELAHTCGWHHGNGKGVPADDGMLLICR